MGKVAVLLLFLVVTMVMLGDTWAGRRGNRRRRGGRKPLGCASDLQDRQKWRKLGGAKSAHLKALGEAKAADSEITCPVANFSVIATWPDLNERATAPWDYIIDHDPNRFPDSLPQARCLCYGCIDVYRGVEDTRLISVPVTYTVKVLYRRGCDSSGRVKYRAKEVKVNVGCTCAVPKKRLVG
ncbi:interleukin-17D-like [Branchiostoma lanceolatum]|uniref:interleukin-17D-like n=1 Tax=Branchiostoma lanceolatum TaxID=7740 RepID=UPI00345530FD